MQKLQPKLRFSEFEGNWQERKLSEFLNFKNGINASKEKYGSGYKFINVLDIIQNDIITHDRIIGSVQISESEFLKNIVEFGDILFQRSSETREEVGQANVYLDKLQPATFGGFVIRGKKKADYDPVFMNFVLKTKTTRNDITSKSGGSTRYNIGQETLSGVSIFFTTLPEQTKIASFLTTVDEKISGLKKQLKLLERYKKGVMQEIFSQKLRFQDENGNDFPDWEEKKLGEVIINFIVPMRDKPKELDGEIPWCRIEDFDGKYLEKSKSNQGVSIETVNKMNLKIFPFNTLLVSCSANLGFCAIVKKPLITNQTFIGLVPNSEVVDVEFLFYIMRLSSNKLNTLSSGTTISYLSREQFEKFVIPKPSLPEQQKIATFLSSIDEKLEKYQGQIKAMENWKKGLLQQMFV